MDINSSGTGGVEDSKISRDESEVGDDMAMDGRISVSKSVKAQK